MAGTAFVKHNETGMIKNDHDYVKRVGSVIVIFLINGALMIIAKSEEKQSVNILTQN